MIVPGKISQYIAITEANEVHLICQPMFELFDLNYFGYFRIYPDATCIGLVSDPLWFEHFITHGFSYQSGKRLTPGQYLWINTHQPIIYQHAREYFNHDHGLFIIEQKKDYLESAIFATSRGNDKILDFYLNYPDLLKQFILYFQHTANPLIKKAALQKMLLGEDPKKIITDEFKIRNAFEQLIFGSPTTGGHMFYAEEGAIHLTKREKECLVSLCQGKAVKSIASDLSISSRTAEVYIKSMRQKFNCSNVTELVAKTLNYVHCSENGTPPP